MPHIRDTLKLESLTKEPDANGYWLLGYRAVFENGGEVRTDVGSRVVNAHSTIVRTKSDARAYLHALELAQRAARWNTETAAEVWSLDRAREALQALGKWAAAGTSSTHLSHLGIHMNGAIMLNGLPVTLAWSPTAFFAYEKHWDTHDIARQPWDIPSPGPAAKVLIEEVFGPAIETWNGDRSIVVKVEAHPSVRSAFDTRHDHKTGPLKGAAKLPAGWWVAGT